MHSSSRNSVALIALLSATLLSCGGGGGGADALACLKDACHSDADCASCGLTSEHLVFADQRYVCAGGTDVLKGKCSLRVSASEDADLRRKCVKSGLECCMPNSSPAQQMAECARASCRKPLACTAGGQCLYDMDNSHRNGHIDNCCRRDSDCPPFPPPHYWDSEHTTASQRRCTRASCNTDTLSCVYETSDACCSRDSPDCDSYAQPYTSRCARGACTYTPEMAQFSVSGAVRCEARVSAECDCVSDGDCTVLDSKCAVGKCEWNDDQQAHRCTTSPRTPLGEECCGESGVSDCDSGDCRKAVSCDTTGTRRHGGLDEHGVIAADGEILLPTYECRYDPAPKEDCCVPDITHSACVELSKENDCVNAHCDRASSQCQLSTAGHLIMGKYTLPCCRTTQDCYADDSAITIARSITTEMRAYGQIGPDSCVTLRCTGGNSTTSPTMRNKCMPHIETVCPLAGSRMMADEASVFSRVDAVLIDAQTAARMESLTVDELGELESEVTAPANDDCSLPTVISMNVPVIEASNALFEHSSVKRTSLCMYFNASVHRPALVWKSMLIAAVATDSDNVELRHPVPTLRFRADSSHNAEGCYFFDYSASASGSFSSSSGYTVKIFLNTTVLSLLQPVTFFEMAEDHFTVEWSDSSFISHTVAGLNVTNPDDGCSEGRTEDEAHGVMADIMADIQSPSEERVRQMRESSVSYSTSGILDSHPADPRRIVSVQRTTERMAIFKTPEQYNAADVYTEKMTLAEATELFEVTKAIIEQEERAEEARLLGSSSKAQAAISYRADAAAALHPAHSNSRRLELEVEKFTETRGQLQALAEVSAMVEAQGGNVQEEEEEERKRFQDTCNFPLYATYPTTPIPYTDPGGWQFHRLDVTLGYQTMTWNYKCLGSTFSDADQGGVLAFRGTGAFVNTLSPVFAEIQRAAYTSGYIANSVNLGDQQACCDGGGGFQTGPEYVCFDLFAGNNDLGIPRATIESAYPAEYPCQWYDGRLTNWTELGSSDGALRTATHFFGWGTLYYVLATDDDASIFTSWEDTCEWLSSESPEIGLTYIRIALGYSGVVNEWPVGDGCGVLFPPLPSMPLGGAGPFTNSESRFHRGSFSTHGGPGVSLFKTGSPEWWVLFDPNGLTGTYDITFTVRDQLGAATTSAVVVVYRHDGSDCVVSNTDVPKVCTQTPRLPNDPVFKPTAQHAYAEETASNVVTVSTSLIGSLDYFIMVTAPDRNTDEFIQVSYSITLPPTFSPTESPTMSPTPAPTLDTATYNYQCANENYCDAFSKGACVGATTTLEGRCSNVIGKCVPRLQKIDPENGVDDNIVVTIPEVIRRVDIIPGHPAILSVDSFCWSRHGQCTDPNEQGDVCHCECGCRSFEITEDSGIVFYYSNCISGSYSLNDTTPTTHVSSAPTVPTSAPTYHPLVPGATYAPTPAPVVPPPEGPECGQVVGPCPYTARCDPQVSTCNTTLGQCVGGVGLPAIAENCTHDANCTHRSDCACFASELLGYFSCSAFVVEATDEPTPAPTVPVGAPTRSPTIPTPEPPTPPPTFQPTKSPISGTGLPGDPDPNDDDDDEVGCKGLPWLQGLSPDYEDSLAETETTVYNTDLGTCGNNALDFVGTQCTARCLKKGGTHFSYELGVRVANNDGVRDLPESEDAEALDGVVIRVSAHGCMKDILQTKDFHHDCTSIVGVRDSFDVTPNSKEILVSPQFTYESKAAIGLEEKPRAFLTVRLASLPHSSRIDFKVRVEGCSTMPEGGSAIITPTCFNVTAQLVNNMCDSMVYSWLRCEPNPYGTSATGYEYDYRKCWDNQTSLVSASQCGGTRPPTPQPSYDVELLLKNKPKSREPCTSNTDLQAQVAATSHVPHFTYLPFATASPSGVVVKVVDEVMDVSSPSLCALDTPGKKNVLLANFSHTFACEPNSAQIRRCHSTESPLRIMRFAVDVYHSNSILDAGAIEGRLRVVLEREPICTVGGIEPEIDPDHVCKQFYTLYRFDASNPAILKKLVVEETVFGESHSSMTVHYAKVKGQQSFRVYMYAFVCDNVDFMKEPSRYTVTAQVFDIDNERTNGAEIRCEAIRGTRPAFYNPRCKNVTLFTSDTVGTAGSTGSIPCSELNLGQLSVFGSAGIESADAAVVAQAYRQVEDRTGSIGFAVSIVTVILISLCIAMGIGGYLFYRANPLERDAEVKVDAAAAAAATAAEAGDRDEDDSAESSDLDYDFDKELGDDGVGDQLYSGSNPWTRAGKRKGNLFASRLHAVKNRRRKDE